MTARSLKPHNQTALIVGAGLAGSLLAIYLARQGWRVLVYERRPDPRARGYLGGRSINLALSARGLWGLAGVGAMTGVPGPDASGAALDALVLAEEAISMRGRTLHPRDLARGLAFQPYSANPVDAINSVSRGGLNLKLLKQAGLQAGVEFHFGQRCIDIDLENGTAAFAAEAAFAPGGWSNGSVPGAGEVTTVEASLIIGADGAFSAVRARLQKTDRFEYSQSYLGHGYKELHIPPRADLADRSPVAPGSVTRERYAMEPNALHIWPRGGSMMIALPNRDGSFTCTLFWPYEGEHSFAEFAGLGAGELRARFAEQYPDVAGPAGMREGHPLMPDLEKDFLSNPVGSLVTIRCWPWSFTGSTGCTTMVLGDAAHAIVPFYGQGMNCAFEDVRVLAEMLASEARDVPAVAREFQRIRKPNADAIAEMAVDNFVEMRDKVGRPEFLYKKRIEQAVHEAFPDRVAPQYNLVSFSTVPYAEAQRRGRELDAVLDKVIARLPASSGHHHESDPARWKAGVREVAEVELRSAGL